MGIFDSFRKECPNPYTRADMEKDIHPSRINRQDAYKDTASYKTHGTRDTNITPLKCAIKKSGDPEIVAELIQNGADVNWVREFDNETVGDLFHIYGDENISLLSILINAGLDLNAKGRWGNTLLYQLIETRNIKLIKLVLEAGADVNSGDSHGNTPISNASAYGASEILKLLIRHGGKVNTKNDMNVTPLFEAILGGQASVVLAFGIKEPKLENIKILINTGADVNAVCNNESILDLAYEIEDEEVIKILKDAGATKRVQK